MFSFGIAYADVLVRTTHSQRRGKTINYSGTLLITVASTSFVCLRIACGNPTSSSLTSQFFSLFYRVTSNHPSFAWHFSCMNNRPPSSSTSSASIPFIFSYLNKIDPQLVMIHLAYVEADHFGGHQVSITLVITT